MPLPSETLLPSATLLPNDGSEPDQALVPTLADIGALLHARTTIEGGSEAGTFNDDTHPTGAQVQAMIDLATPAMLVQLPEDTPVGLYGTVRLVVALQVAVMLERSYFPEQVAQGSSPVEGFEAQLATTMAALLSAAADNQVGGTRVYGVPITTPTATYAADPSALLP
jgi:hypothetical protein